ncbi:MAG: TIGR03086 family metal-binding protein [Carbonactinosporaceae bacterium]
MDDQMVIERAVSATGSVFRDVSPAQHGAPTPCEAWDVRALMNHVIAGNRYFAALARGEAGDTSVWQADHIGDVDPALVYEESAVAALDAWRLPGAVERVAPLPSGGQGPRLFDIHLADLIVHGWDLASATGQDRSLDPEVVQAVYDMWHGKLPPEIRGTVFGTEVECAPDAPVADRLAAYLGRNP